MSDFFSPPFFGGPQLTATDALNYVTVGTRYRSTVMVADPSGTGSPQGISSVPWGYQCSGIRYVNAPYVAPIDPPPPPDPPVDPLIAANAELAAAYAALGVARAQLAAAQAAYSGPEEAADAAMQEVIKAGINLDTLTRRGVSDLSGAQTRLAAAQAALPAALAARNAAGEALLGGTTGIPYALSRVHNALGGVAAATAVDAGRAFENNMTALTQANWEGASPQVDPETGETYVVYDRYDAGPLVINPGDRSPNTTRPYADPFNALGWNDWTQYGEDAEGNVISYSVAGGSGQYQHTLTLTDAAHATLSAARQQVVLTWTEVTSMFEAATLSDGGGLVYGIQYGEPTVSYALKTETFSIAGAVQDDGGWWTITGSIHSVAMPDIGSPNAPPGAAVFVQILGPPSVPFCTALTEYQGAERYRQGWMEFETAADSAYPRRYLRMAASTAPGTVGVTYSGAIVMQPLPDDYDTNPGAYPNLVFGDYQLPVRPLVLDHTGLSPSAATNFPLPASLAASTDGATLASATKRTMSTPKGLTWTLSNEQTPADIAADAGAVRDRTWPTDASTAPSLPLLMAIEFFSPDHVIRQKMRFKLTYFPGTRAITRRASLARVSTGPSAAATCSTAR